MADFESPEIIIERTRANMRANEVRMLAILKAGLEKVKFVMKNRDVPEEEAAVITVGA
jgi:hypothetical protein